MSYQRSFIVRSPALVWLHDHPEVAEEVRRSVGVHGVAFADAVLDDPTMLLELNRQAVLRSVRDDTPAGVTEELLRCYRTLSERAARTSSARTALAPVLSSLKGSRDREEVIALLSGRLDGVTDELIRKPVERLMRAASRELMTLKPDGAEHVVVTITEPGPDPGPEPSGPERSGPESGGEGTTEPGTGTPGRVTTTEVVPEGVGTPEAPVFDEIAEAGRQGGGELAAQHGVDVSWGQSLGAQYATQMAPGFQASPTGDTSGGSGASRFWGIVFGAVGGLIAGPVGAAGGYLFGVSFGHSGVGSQAAAGLGQLAHSIHEHVQPEFDLTYFVNCTLCGPSCEPCTLADQVLNP